MELKQSVVSNLHLVSELVKQEKENIFKSSVVNELEKIINNYVIRKRLFCGGCCYASYLLAKALKMLNIEYKVVIFQYDMALDLTDFSELMSLQADGCAHVAIEVTIAGNKHIIGTYDKIVEYFTTYGYYYKMQHYDNVQPETLLEFYRMGYWNHMYDVRNNAALSRHINSITEKYSD